MRRSPKKFLEEVSTVLTSEFHSNDEFHPKRQDKSSDPFYSEENLARLKESIEQLKRGQVVEKNSRRT